MNIVKNIVMWTGFVLCFSTVIVSTTAKVQAEAIDFQISPAVSSLYVKPGTVFRIPVELTNYGDPQQVVFRVYRLGNQDKNGNLSIVKEHQGVSLQLQNSLVSLNAPFLLLSNETKKIDLEVSLDKTIADGEYIYTLIAEALPNQVTQGNINLRLHNGLGTTLYIKVTKDLKTTTSAHISQFTAKTSKSFWLLSENIQVFAPEAPIPVILSVANTGKYSIQPDIMFRLKSSTGTIEELQLPPSKVSPQGDRIIQSTEYSSANCLAEFDEKICGKDISFIIKQLNTGFYTMTAEIKIPGSSTVITASKNIAVVPYFLVNSLVALLLFSLVLIGVLLMKLRNVKHKVTPTFIGKNLKRR